MNNEHNILTTFSELSVSTILGLVALGTIAIALSAVKLIHKVMDSKSDK